MLPHLEAMLVHLGAMLAHLVGLSWGLGGQTVRPMLTMLSQKIRKMGTAKKHCKPQGILKVGGLSWG